MGVPAISKAARSDAGVLAVIDSLKSTKTKHREAQNALEELTPVVEGAHPVRLLGAGQLSALIQGILVELLPESPLVTAAISGAAGMTALAGAWWARPDIVSAASGALAPYTSWGGGELVRRARAYIAARPAETAATEPVNEPAATAA